MNEKIMECVRHLKVMPPAAPEDIIKLEEKIGISLPIDYKEFMLFSNGAFGIIGSSYLQIYSIEDTTAINKMSVADRTLCLTPESKPVVCFGSDGGGMSYAFDKRTKASSIITFPLISIISEEYQICGRTFNEFLLDLYNL